MTDPSWIFGFHAALGAIESGRPVEVVWLQKGRHDRRLQRLVDAARDRGVAVRWVPKSRLDGIAEAATQRLRGALRSCGVGSARGCDRP
jgi:23S rRNA (guanosine2251-2'-O)-methyltransferase